MKHNLKRELKALKWKPKTIKYLNEECFIEARTGTESVLQSPESA